MSVEKCCIVAWLLDGMLVHGGGGGGGLNGEFSPRDPCVLIIESPNVAVFPGCFQGPL